MASSSECLWVHGMVDTYMTWFSFWAGSASYTSVSADPLWKPCPAQSRLCIHDMNIEGWGVEEEPVQTSTRDLSSVKD